jgi:gliding motility-associated-like protein
MYKIRVYTNGNNINQSTSFNLCITTPEPILNDDCDTATEAIVNQGLDCIAVTAGSVTGATASALASTCPGTEDDDVWFSFVATSITHVITLQNIVGTSILLNSALYSGDQCGSITFISCHNTNQTVVNNLVVGNTYKIRVWSNSAVLEDIRFDLCIGSIVPPITVNTTQYTNPQLVTDVLIQSDCAAITNINWATGATPATNGIGYFNRGPSNFPFEDGIVMVTGSATSAVGPNTSILSGGGLGGDADLSAILAAQNPPQTGSLNNATRLGFDFVALTDEINFNFMFASDEYGTFQCSFSDAFAFILTDLTAGTPAVNLAVIPGTNIPVSVVNIRDSQYNGGCPSANVAFFGNYYQNTAGILGAPVNFNGITVPMVATSAVVPGNSYRIKMVIADYNDGSFDSAVFLEGGSFDLGNIAFPEDFLVDEGTALCFGDQITLNSGLDPALFNIQWFNNGVLIPGANGPTLTVTAGGNYSVVGTLIGTTCTVGDGVIVEYFTDAAALIPSDLVICSAATSGIFDLTVQDEIILSPFLPGLHQVLYFLTEADAINGVNALTQAEAEAFTGTSGQMIFVRVNLLGTTCFQTLSFLLVIQDFTPEYTLDGALEICPEGETTITVVPTDNSFDVTTAVFEWTFNTVVIAGANASSLLIEGEAGVGIYTVSVTNLGCIDTRTFEITLSTGAWDIVFDGTLELCPDETGILTADVTNNEDNEEVTYTFTLPDGTEVESTINTLEISAPGTYIVEVDILGCTSTATFEVEESDAQWDIVFDGTLELCPDETGILTADVTNNEDNEEVTYTFMRPDGTEVESTINTLEISAPGTYIVEVDILGCTSTATFIVDESDKEWNVTFSGTIELCPDETGTLTALVTDNTDNEPVTYTFTLANGSQVVTTNNVLTITEPGDYSVVADILGCDSAAVSFTVGNKVGNWQVTFTDDPYEICEGESVLLSFLSGNFDIDDANATYAWTGPAGVTGQGKTFTTNQVGLHTLTVNILGCTSIFDIDVLRNDLEIAIDFTQGCENNAYRLVATPSDDSFEIATSEFVWTGPSVIATDEPNAIILGANGVYTLTATNADGCSATQSITVNNISCTIQKGISPNNDTNNEFFDLSTLNVRELSIFNRYGTEVYKFGAYTNQWRGQSSSGDDLPDGTYFYIIQTVAGENISGWIFINR